MKVENVEQLVKKMTDIKLSIYDIQSLSNFHDIQIFQETKLAEQQKEILKNNIFKNYLFETVSKLEKDRPENDNPWSNLIKGMES